MARLVQWGLSLKQYRGETLIAILISPHLFSSYQMMSATSLPQFLTKMFSQATKIPNTESYGLYLFKGVVAAPYLERQGLPADTLNSPDWATNGNADKVKNNFILSI